MLDHTRLGEFIEQVRLTPAIWKNRDYGIEKAHLDEIWAHFGHTFDISASEAENQWKYLIRLHKLMHKDHKNTKFRISVDMSENVWNDADLFVADSLEMFFKNALDELLLIKKPTESSV